MPSQRATPADPVSEPRAVETAAAKASPARRAPRGVTRERIYEYVRERLLQGDPPTVREVQQAVGLRAVESARVHLQRLVDEGRLEKAPGLSRSLRLPPGTQARESSAGPGSAAAGWTPSIRDVGLVPVLGRVQAGGLTEAVEAPDGHVASMAVAGADPRRLFALRVSGESMTEAGILDGDVVVVRGDLEARDGDVVVAVVDGEATVKRLRLRGEECGGGRRDGDRVAAGRLGTDGLDGGLQPRVVLEPAHREFAPIVPDPERLEILGRVTEVRRTL